MTRNEKCITGGNQYNCSSGPRGMKSLINPNVYSEGLVFVANDDNYPKNKLSFKILSNNYLLKHDG